VIVVVVVVVVVIIIIIIVVIVVDAGGRSLRERDVTEVHYTFSGGADHDGR